MLWFLQVIVSGWGTTKEYGEQSEFLQMVGQQTHEQFFIIVTYWLLKVFEI